MSLNYLDFDYSEDTEGIGVFDAMASVRPERLAAVHAEVAQVLEWAHAAFAGRRGPVEEGGEWDYDLQDVHDAQEAEAQRRTVTLSISGSPTFCAAFREAFNLPA